MSAAELLVVVQQAGIVLRAAGDRLIYDAPKGAMTSELRADLARHKPALLALLTMQYVDLKGGLVLPLPAVLLALDLERCGFRMSIDADQQFQIAASPELTDKDREGIRRWRRHLGAIISYNADLHESVQ